MAENDAAVIGSIDVTRIVENILQVRPETTTIAVVIGNSPVEKFWYTLLSKLFEPRSLSRCPRVLYM